MIVIYRNYTQTVKIDFCCNGQSFDDSAITSI